MRKLILILTWLGAMALLTLPFFALHARGATYYVDGSFGGTSDGSTGNPFKTIQAAVTVAVPGDTVRIRSGVYREGISVPNTSAFASADPAARGTGPKLSILADDAATVVVKGSDLLSTGAGLWVQADPSEYFGTLAAGTPRIWRYTGALTVNVQQLVVYPAGADPNQPATALGSSGKLLTKLGYPSGYFASWVNKAVPPEGAVTETSPGSGWDSGANALGYMTTTNGPGTFYLLEAGHMSGGSPVTDTRTLYARLATLDDPNMVPIELSARSTVVRNGNNDWPTRDHGNLYVRGIHFRHSNTLGTSGNVNSGISTGHSSTWESCDIQQMDCVGLSMWDFSTVTNCVVSNNGNSGLGAGGGCLGLLVAGGQLDGNNYRGFSFGWHCGGAKMIPNHAFTDQLDVTFDGVEVANNNGPGIWIDSAYEFTSGASPYRKTVRNCIIRSNAWYGVFAECSPNGHVLGNIIVGNVRKGVYLDGCSSWWTFNNTVVGTLPKPIGATTDDESAGVDVHGLRPTIPSEAAQLGGAAYWPSAHNRVLNNIIAFNQTQQQLRIFRDDSYFGAMDTRSDFNCLWQGVAPGWRGPSPRALFGLVYLKRTGNSGTGDPVVGFDLPRGNAKRISGTGALPADGWHSGSAAMDVHSVIADPLFLMENGAVQGWRLISSSRARDRGLDLDWILGYPTADLYGTARPKGTAWCIGAVEQ